MNAIIYFCIFYCSVQNKSIYFSDQNLYPGVLCMYNRQ